MPELYMSLLLTSKKKWASITAFFEIMYYHKQNGIIFNVSIFSKCWIPRYRETAVTTGNYLRS